MFTRDKIENMDKQTADKKKQTQRVQIGRGKTEGNLSQGSEFFLKGYIDSSIASLE